jgi:uncharacterized membrane protein YjjB (DUF3815 family)
MTPGFFLEQAVCGAVAAAGFGMLFNVGFRLLPWCATTGALALAVRTSFLAAGWSLEGASFAAALAVGAAAQLMRTRTGLPQDVLDVAGCIPMVPGSFAAKAIIGLFALTTSGVVNEPDTLITATQYTLRVLFTIGAIGTGLAIPTYLVRARASR